MINQNSIRKYIIVSLIAIASVGLLLNLSVIVEPDILQGIYYNKLAHDSLAEGEYKIARQQSLKAIRHHYLNGGHYLTFIRSIIKSPIKEAQPTIKSLSTPQPILPPPSNSTISQIYKYGATLIDVVKITQNRFIASQRFSPTNLPAYHIDIANNDYEKLTAELPLSGWEYAPAQITLPNGTKQRSEVKFRGGSPWHWERPKKSWRLKIKNGKSETHINLINSRFKMQLGYGFGYYLSREAGVLTPSHNFALLYLNGEYQGVFEQVEQTDQAFLANHNLSYGDIFFGEADDFKITDKILGIYGTPEVWEHIPTLGADPEIGTIQLAKLLSIIQSDQEIDFNQLEGLLDIDKILRYIAILDISMSRHIDNMHNFKMYLNPDTGLFEPIAWDNIEWPEPPAIFDQRLNMSSNIIFSQLLKNPKYAELKNRYIWDFIHEEISPQKVGQYISQEAEKLKYPLFFDPQKDYVAGISREAEARGFLLRPLSYSAWQNSIEYLIDWYASRTEYVLGELQAFELTASFAPSESTLNLDVIGEAGYDLISTNCNCQISAERDITASIDNGIYAGFQLKYNKSANLKSPIFHHQLVRVPLRYQYRITSEAADITLSSITVKNRITGETKEIPVQQLNSLDELSVLPASESIHPWHPNI